MAITVAIVAITLLQAGSGPTAELGVPGEAPYAGGGAELPQQGARGTVLTYSLCVEKGQQVSVSSVDAFGGVGGLEVSGFVVVPASDAVVEGWIPSGIPAVYKQAGSKTVSSRCGSPPYDALFLEVQAPAAQISTFEGVRLRYEGNGAPLTLNFSMRICQVPLDSPACQNAS